MSAASLSHADMTNAAFEPTKLYLPEVNRFDITDVGDQRCSFPRPLRGRGGTFWDRIDASSDGCWPWMRGHDPEGYGRGLWGKTSTAHRHALELATGIVQPRGIEACHTCDNPPCCNPAHLFWGTHQENLLDAAAKGHLGRNRGERHGNHKLTEADVRAIRYRAAQGANQHQLARDFGVSQVAIHFVVTRQTWRHVDAATEEAAS